MLHHLLSNQCTHQYYLVVINQNESISAAIAANLTLFGPDAFKMDLQLPLVVFLGPSYLIIPDFETLLHVFNETWVLLKLFQVESSHFSQDLQLLLIERH